MQRPGYLKLWRGIVDKPIWKQSTPEHKVILIQILVMADFTGNEWEYKGEKFKTKPGQFITSLQKIAEECGKGVSVQNVRSALARFERLGFITNESTKINRLITIVNWGLYQSSDEEGNKDTNIVTNNQLTKNQQNTNKEVTTKEEVKKVRSKEEKNKSKKKEKKLSAFDFFQENGFGCVTPYIFEDLKYYFEVFESNSDDIIIAALKIAKDRNKVNWGYAKSILKTWHNANLKSIDQVRAYETQQLALKRQERTWSNRRVSKELTPHWLENRENSHTAENVENDLELEKERQAFLEKLKQKWGD